MAFFNIDNEMKRRQAELAERQQRLDNDPGRIFLKSMAQSAPRALFNALGSAGVNLATNAANYNLFGGKERSEAQIRELEGRTAERFRVLREPYLRENYPGVLPPRQPQQAKDEIQRPPMPEKMPDIIDLKDGTFAVEVPTAGLTQQQIEQQGLVSDPNLESLNRAIGPGREGLGDILGPRTELDKVLSQPSAGQKMYKIMDQKQVSKMQSDYNKKVAAAKSPLPTPESLRGDGQPLSLDSRLLESQAEFMKREELGSLERRKYAELTASQRKKRQDLLKGQLTEEIKNSYNYMALSTAEQLAQKKQDLIDRLKMEQDPVMRDVYANAIQAMPKESQRAEAERLFRENKGTVSVGSVRIGERNKVIVNYNEKPTRVKVKDAAMDAQSEINRMDLILADPGRVDEHAYAAKRRRAMLAQLKDYSEMENVLTPILLDPQTGYLIVKASEEDVVGKELERPPAGGITARTSAFNADKKASYDSIKANPGAQEMFTEKVNDKIRSGKGVEAAREEAAIEMIGADGLLRPDLRGPGSGAAKKTKETKPSYPNLKAKKGGILNYATDLVDRKKITAEELKFIEDNAGPYDVKTTKAWIAGTVETLPQKNLNRAKLYFENNLKK